jgi:hypothetical protein
MNAMHRAVTPTTHLTHLNARDGDGLHHDGLNGAVVDSLDLHRTHVN